jgi:lipopolysaccharide transport system ATP-binding protein
VASLLEVGTGFHPELTGRENIYLNGAILGMTQREIRARFDEIVAFAEVERFLDTPVKRYSSGMYVRLAFAVAAHLEPEILVVDEVLAVGDACFQRKCLGKMEDVADKEGRTVLFVSHNMTAVSSLCSSAKLLSNGRLVQEGLPAEVVNTYLDLTYVEKHQVWEGPPIGDNIAKVRRASVSQNGRITLNSHEPIQIELEIEIRKSIYGLIVGWEVWSQQEELLAYTLWDDIQDPPGIVTDIGIYRIGLEIPANTFAAGSYVASLDLGIHNQRRIIPAKVISLHLMIENTLGIGRRYPVSVNALRPEWHWKVLPISESHQFSENQKRIESDD